jgi:nitrogen fixation/metabolism regulation signal transduction histidine kinase
MSIKWKFILWGVIFYLIAGIALYFLLDVNKWLFIGGELALIFSLILFIMLYNQLVRPIGTISSAIHLLQEKDFTTRLAKVHQKEIDQLIDVYNKMSEQLLKERVEHEEKNLFLDRLINASPSAIIVLNANFEILKLNPVAEDLLGISHTQLPIKIQTLSDPWSVNLSKIKPGEETSIRVDSIRRFKISCSSFMDRGFQRPFILIEELTTELMKAERQSYEKVIRMMSHEVNNAVGAINSVMQSVLSMENRFEKDIRKEVVMALEASIKRNQSMSSFMANFANLVKIPEPQIRECNFKNTLLNVIKLFESECEQRNIELSLNIDELWISADAAQMEHVIHNILKNSVEAISQNGKIIINLNSEEQFLSIQDSGIGFDEITQQKLFTPFYSSKKSGQGIGLTLIREVLNNHEFSFNLYKNQEGYTEFRVNLF